MRALTRVASALLIAAFLTRATISDRLPLLATLYYATPWPILSICSAICSAFWLALGQRATAVLFAATAIISIVFWYRLDWARNPPPSERSEIRVVFWNAGRPGPDIRSAADALNALNADIIAMSEAGSQYSQARQSWAAAFPYYQVQILPGGMIFLTRGAVWTYRFERFTGRSKLAILDVVLQGRDVTVLQADLDPNVLRSRKADFEQIATRIPRDGPVLLLGDFNTPHDSAHFGLFRRAGLRHAFIERGSGPVATWPLPLPVLAIDHILVRDFQITNCELVRLTDSDHRAVIADLSLTGSADQ